MVWCCKTIIVILFVVGQVKGKILPDRPRLRTEDGNLILETGKNRNISLNSVGNGCVTVNGIDISRSYALINSVRPQLQVLNTSTLGFLIQNLSRVVHEVSSQSHLAQTLDTLRTQVQTASTTVTNLQTNYQTIHQQVTLLTANVSSLNIQRITPEQSQLLQNFLNRAQNGDTTSTSDTATRRQVTDLRQKVTSIELRISNLGELEERINTLESSTGNWTGGPSRVSQRASNELRKLKRDFRKFKRTIFRRIKRKVETDNCLSNPCRHGGTCIDITTGLGFMCLCPTGFEGANCDDDVNECREFIGTDLGCQNGATCSNSLGSYSCVCATGWYGVHCTQKTDSCSTSASPSICGHGTCINTPKNGHSYSCICEQGWESYPHHPACTKDVDECQGNKPPCSHDPPVQCINTPGSFTCGHCPQGYEGNGHVCRDIDECAVNNGGCSLVPRVQCFNTRGSRTCGPCPAGYTGNGETCSQALSPCQRNPNPCHPQAVCQDNINMSPTWFNCICGNGYTGNGVGPSGCVPATQGGIPYNPNQNPCVPSPCLHGICSAVAGQAHCTCSAGYTGLTCSVPINLCDSSPCLNGGTCTSSLTSFTCSCPSSHTGNRCQTPSTRCGGRRRGHGGNLEYPGPNQQTYDHNLSCAWVISVNRSLVINVTFTKFNLEGGRGCISDFLQIHDGPRSNSHLIQRACGNRLPGDNNGTIISTHNHLYMWFRSDHNNARDGFAFTWEAIEPKCGGTIKGEHSSIMSPGYPGLYPHNRDCYWTIETKPGTKINIHFAIVQIEHHDNCSYDYLAVYDGFTAEDTQLAKICSTMSHQPITTSGSEAMIHFHSDVSQSDTGFHLTYSSIPGIPGCGGLFTVDSATFSTPILRNEYRSNITCEWGIRLRPGEKIELNFTAFHLEHHRNCYFDYVEVYDGGARDAPLIGRFCGDQLPEPILSSSNELFIIFKTDHTIGGQGFTATYALACGGEYTASSGVITSPYFPAYYPHDRTCYYTLRQPPGYALILNFTTFLLEDGGNCRWDHLIIHDGLNHDARLIGKFCGPDHRVANPVISSLNALFLEFKTDGTIHNKGFQAYYTTIPIRCGGIHHELTGTINSPNDEGSYPGNTDCWYVIQPPAQYVIQLSWHSFSLESHFNCESDYMEVFDNSSVPAPGGRISSRYCGSRIPPAMTSTGNVMTLHFHSNRNVNHDGFSVSYHSIDPNKGCKFHYHTSSGRIVSPGYPSGYPPLRTCSWTITVPVNHQIRLNVTDFDLEGPEPACPHDHLKIRNGGLESSPLLKTLCGKNKTVPTIYSHGHELHLHFKSDQTDFGRGFEVFWEETATGCGGTLTSPNGEFISPGYPQPFHRFADCIWNIRVNKGSKITFHFVDLDISPSRRCYSSYVEARNGPSKNSKLIGRYCNNQESFTSFNTTGNELFIKFQGGWGNGKGFHARYFSGCNVELTGHTGVIESPNYPDPYPHNRNCTWVIKAPLGNAINISFSHFDVEDPHFNNGHTCIYDYVELRSGHQKSQNPSSRTNVIRYCGTRIPNPYSSGDSFDIVEVQFLSDHSVPGNGFRLEWTVHGCGGILTELSGNFTSPNFPIAYPVNTHCEWHIRVQSGYRIKFQIRHFDVESSFTAHNCTFDALTFYGGPDKSSPVLVSLCHHDDRIPKLETQGNEALVTFESDSSVRGKGFEISYSSEEGGCGGDFDIPSGVIHSPNYPEKYDDHSDCTWKLASDPNTVVELTFVDFDVEPVNNCTYDYVGIYDGPGISYPMIHKFCGPHLPDPPTVRSSGRFLTVRLKADGSNPAKGFKAKYKDACGAKINVTADDYYKSIQSPKYPGLLTPHTECIWFLQSVEGFRIHLRFSHMNIHADEAQIVNNATCPLNYVQILDGDTELSPEIGRYCGNFLPRDIYSTSHFITIKLHTKFVHGTGFKLLYSPTDVACGGDRYSIHGEFASPNYPDSYPASYECIWSIVAGYGNRIRLNFDVFDIEESDYCNLDYLEVHEGDATGPLLLHNCSSTVPPSITATGGFWVKFRSDETGTAPGFLANHNLLSRNDIISDSGTISSPLYPHIFTTAGNYLWSITVSSGKYISFTIEEISIEVDPVHDICFSSLVIYDGPRETNNVLKTLCGYATPEASIVTTGNVALVKFISDYRHEGSYFKLRYNTVEDFPYDSIYPVSQGPNPNCSYRVTVNSSTINISSPNYPNNYDNNLNCQWIIQTEKHSSLLLRVEAELEENWLCYYDKLELYDGIDGTMNWNKTATICQRGQRRATYRSTGSVYMVRFITDGYTTKKGFIIHITKACGGVLTESDGVIKSPRYPRNYNSYAFCRWTLKAPVGKTIRMQFHEFKIANSSASCRDSYLLIYNGATRSSPFLGRGRYCGVRSTPEIPETSSNNALLIFRTGYANRAKGFYLTYEHLSAGCGERHQLSDMVTFITIKTPNYPNPPHPHTECTWIVTAPADKSLTLNFIDTFELAANFDGSCDKSYVEVRGGGTELSPSIGKYCGKTHPNTLHADGIMYIKYVTDAAEVHTGFKATIETGKCGGRHRFSTSYLLSSPNYPNPYDNEMNCTWHLIGPPGHYLIIEYVEINIYNPSVNCTLDYGKLKIIEPVINVTEVICGTGVTRPNTETAASNVTIIFTNSRAGGFTNRFRLKIRASKEVCGGTQEGVQGHIQSPGYPHGSSHARECEFIIKGPPGTRITLTIEDADFVRHDTYRFCLGYIKIYNGNSDISPFMAFISCRSTVPISVNSSMNTMKVSLIVRKASYNRGFKASWNAYETQECGGILDQPSGSVLSPGYELGTYNHSRFCAWTLLNPNPGETSMNVTIHHLHLEKHCFDFVMIRGYDEADQLLDSKKICQGEETMNFVFPYPTTKIFFVSDHSIAATGFNVSYSTSNCGGFKAEVDTNISSPGYTTGGYPPDTICAWLFMYPEGSQVELEFTDFKLEDSLHHDYVIFYNGNGVDSKRVIGQYTGTKSPGTVGPSMRNNARVEFHSDHSTNDKGFSAIARAHTKGCGGVYHGISGTFFSPKFDKGENYPPNFECVWEVTTEPGYQILATFLDHFDLETSDNCQKDFVSLSVHEVENGVNTWVEKVRKCGKEMPPPIQTNSSSFRIRLRTNENIQGKGFKLRYTGKCGGTYKGSGVIMSPNYPLQYPASTECIYKIDAAEQAFVLLNFTDMKISYNGECRYSRLTITQKRNNVWWWSRRNWHTTITTLCGSELPEPMTLRGPVYLNFTSSRYVYRSDKGFLLHYTIKDCGGNVTEPQDIHLPTQPDNYLESMDCVWDIKAPEGKIVYMKFQQLHIEFHPKCNYDYLDIFSGFTNDPSKRVQRFCGDHTDALSELSRAIPSSEVRVAFKSDISGEAPGFKATIVFTWECGGTVNVSEAGAQQTIRSLDKDNDGKYEPYLKCRWEVLGNEDMVLALNFTRLDVEGPGVNDNEDCPYDYVKIYDGPSESSTLIGTFCGSTLPSEAIIASRNVMIVVFHSDSINQTAGFTATLSNMPTRCGAAAYTATSTTQSLDSPNYPSHYPTSLRCRYVISAPAEKRIILHIDEFKLQGSSKCNKDYVFIGELPDEDQTMDLTINPGPRNYHLHEINLGGRKAYFDFGTMLNHKYCGEVNSQHLTSSSNNIEIQFVSDDSETDSGFRFHYILATCNLTYTTESGSIRDFGESGNCYMKIQAPSDHFVALYVWYISFSSNSQGSFKIYDGDSASAPQLRNFEERTGRENPIYSTGNSLYIVITDPGTYHHYRLSYSTSQFRNGCGGKFFGKRNTITSPNYPGTPSGNMTCDYLVAVPHNYHAGLLHINLDFGSSGGCNSTYLEVYDVLKSNEVKRFATFCPGDEPARHLSPTNKIILRYVVGTEDVTGTGWRAYVYGVTPHQDTNFDDDDENPFSTTAAP